MGSAASASAGKYNHPRQRSSESGDKAITERSSLLRSYSCFESDVFDRSPPPSPTGKNINNGGTDSSVLAYHTTCSNSSSSSDSSVIGAFNYSGCSGSNSSSSNSNSNSSSSSNEDDLRYGRFLLYTTGSAFCGMQHLLKPNIDPKKEVNDHFIMSDGNAGRLSTSLVLVNIAKSSSKESLGEDSLFIHQKGSKCIPNACLDSNSKSSKILQHIAVPSSSSSSASSASSASCYNDTYPAPNLREVGLSRSEAHTSSSLNISNESSHYTSDTSKVNIDIDINQDTLCSNSISIPDLGVSTQVQICTENCSMNFRDQDSDSALDFVTNLQSPNETIRSRLILSSLLEAPLPKAIDLLQECFASRENINIREFCSIHKIDIKEVVFSNGNPAIHEAVRSKNKILVEYLIIIGCNLQRLNSQNESCMQIAQEAGDIDILEAVLAALQTPAQSPRSNLSVTSSQQCSLFSGYSVGIDSDYEGALNSAMNSLRSNEHPYFSALSSPAFPGYNTPVPRSRMGSFDGARGGYFTDMDLTLDSIDASAFSASRDNDKERNKGHEAKIEQPPLEKSADKGKQVFGRSIRKIASRMMSVFLPSQFPRSRAAVRSFVVNKKSTVHESSTCNDANSQAPEDTSKGASTTSDTTSSVISSSITSQGSGTSENIGAKSGTRSISTQGLGLVGGFVSHKNTPTKTSSLRDH